MLKKHLSLYNRYIPINNKLVLGHSKVFSMGASARNKDVDELVQTVGGLLITDRNIVSGKGVKGPERRRPIKFII